MNHLNDIQKANQRLQKDFISGSTTTYQEGELPRRNKSHGKRVNKKIYRKKIKNRKTK